MASEKNSRAPQLAYSQLQAKMLDEQRRREKARKIISVLHHYLGRTDLAGLEALDIGCSAGFIANALAEDGAHAVGIDIDEPGVAAARDRFGSRVEFRVESGDALQAADESLDVVVFNHIYEHVVDPAAVFAEIHRTLKPGGVAYLALGNKYQVMEPHYRLPFLSWLPKRAADAYVSRAGKADDYYEQFATLKQLKTLVAGFHVYDYTRAVIRNPLLFHAEGDQPGFVSKLPDPLVTALWPVVPTFIWVATKTPRSPAGPRIPLSTVPHHDLVH